MKCGRENAKYYSLEGNEVVKALKEKHSMFVVFGRGNLLDQQMLHPNA